MTRLSKNSLLALFGVLIGSGLFLASWYRSERQTPLIDLQISARRLEQVGLCLDEQRALANSYPIALASIEDCAKERGARLEDAWGNDFLYCREVDGNYLLASAGPDEVMAETYGSVSSQSISSTKSDDLIIGSGRWLSPALLLDLPNHSLEVEMDREDYLNRLKLRVSTSGRSYGFVVKAWVVGEGAWKIGVHRLDAKSGRFLLWRHSRDGTLDQRQALESYAVVCPSVGSTLVFQVSESRSLEAIVGDNTATVVVTKEGCSAARLSGGANALDG